MKYHKFFYATEPEAQAFVASIEGDFQSHIEPCYSEVEPVEDGEESAVPELLGFMVDVCGRKWTADMSNEVRPTTHKHWFSGMEEYYFNSISNGN